MLNVEWGKTMIENSVIISENTVQLRHKDTHHRHPRIKYSIYNNKLKLNTDERGSFIETVKLNSGGQVSFSTTAPGITRGNH